MGKSGKTDKQEQPWDEIEYLQVFGAKFCPDYNFTMKQKHFS